MMVKVKFEAGAVGAPHTHPHTQVTYVASGVFKFTTDGETKVIRTGDGVYMKSGVLHGCECVEAGVLIDTFNPVREDFCNCQEGIFDGKLSVYNFLSRKL